ncbi:MAG: DUF2202 domain-containing protein [Dehalococcoidia bacterium]
MNRRTLAVFGVLAASAALFASVACNGDDDDGGAQESPSAAGTATTIAATGTAAGTSGTSELTLEEVLTEAINEEYKAHATYQAVLDKFGNVAPFNNIINAEQSHIDAWKRLFTANNMPVPADPFAGKVQAPESLKAACEAGVAAEEENVALYDRLMKSTTDAQSLAVMEQQRTVSQENHLPAFQACAK